MISELIDKLANGQEDERLFAAEDLGYSGDPLAAVPLIRTIETEQSRGVRIAIGQALRQLEEPSTVERALALLSSDDAFVRNQAVELLRARGTSAMPILCELSSYPDSDVRKFCLDVLAEVYSDSVAEIYRKALTDEDLNVAITAIENIGTFRMEALEGAVLNTVSESQDPMLISAALTTLSQIASSASVPRLLDAFAPLQDQPEIYLIPLLRVLAKYGSAADVPAIVLVLDRQKPRSSETALEALSKILKRHGAEGIDTASLLAGLQRAARTISSGAGSLLSAVADLTPGAENIPELHSSIRSVE